MVTSDTDAPRRTVVPQPPLPAQPAVLAPAAVEYRAEMVTDPASLFNGFFFYGDGMVNDHLTSPFEKALLSLVSDQER